MAKDSPAVKFLGGQHEVRAAIRVQFREDAGDFLDVHEFILSAIASCLDRFGGKKWPGELDPDTVAKMTQVSQLTALFLHGVDLCEVAIAEGLYGQAAALVRQHMEILAAMDEVWAGRRVPNRTPNIGSLPDSLRPHYGGLSEMAHASVPDYLHQLFTGEKGDLIGASIVPQYNAGMALFLYRLELGLMAEFALRQDHALRAAYGEGFNEEERMWLAVGVAIGNKAAEMLPHPEARKTATQ